MVRATLFGDLFPVPDHQIKHPVKGQNSMLIADQMLYSRRLSTSRLLLCCFSRIFCKCSYFQAVADRLLVESSRRSTIVSKPPKISTVNCGGGPQNLEVSCNSPHLCHHRVLIRVHVVYYGFRFRDSARNWWWSKVNTLRRISILSW